MSEILERGVFLNCLLDQAEAPWEVEAEMIRAHDAALRLALETATREAEEERRTAEAAVKFLGRIAEVTWEAGLPSGDREQTLKNVRALASPADAAREAAREDAVTAWARLAVALLSRHESAWEHDPGPYDEGCDEDCRACEYVGLLRTGRAALSSPAVATTKEK